MGMVELVILACLLQHPEHCETFTIPFQMPMTEAQCVWRSQMNAAQWVHDHPGWVLKRMSCELPQA
jgi:hypothetical protein